MMIAVSKAAARIAHRSAIASTRCNSAGNCTAKCKNVVVCGLDLALNYKLSVQNHRNKVSSQDVCGQTFQNFPSFIVEKYPRKNRPQKKIKIQLMLSLNLLRYPPNRAKNASCFIWSRGYMALDQFVPMH